MITIEQAVNGYVVKSTSEDSNEMVVIEQEDDVSDAKCFQRLIYVLQDMLGIISSKYDDEKFYAVVAPGPDNQNYKGLDFAHWGEYYKEDDIDGS